MTAIQSVPGPSGAPAAPQQAPEPAPQQRPDLRVVPAPRPRRLRHLTRILSIVTVAAFFGVLFGLAAFHASLAQGQYELGELETRLEQLAEDRIELELAAQELESPGRVAQIAQEILGLVSPEHTEDLYPTAGEAAAVLDAGTPIDDVSP